MDHADFPLGPDEPDYADDGGRFVRADELAQWRFKLQCAADLEARRAAEIGELLSLRREVKELRKANQKLRAAISEAALMKPVFKTALHR